MPVDDPDNAQAPDRADLTSALEGQSRNGQTEPKTHDIREPDWDHWRQRGYVRVWVATLLSLNVHPTVEARTALRELNDSRYADYNDRLRIAKAQLGRGLPLSKDHPLEGGRPGEKYVSLVDYYRFAEGLNWKSLHAMGVGLRIKGSPLPIEANPSAAKAEPSAVVKAASAGKKSSSNGAVQRELNNVFILLHELLNATIPGFDVDNVNASAKKIDEWLGEKKARRPVQLATLTNWVVEMHDLVEDFDRRNGSR